MIESFRGVRFVLFGFNDPSRALLVRSKLVSGGGQDVGQYCQSCTHFIVDKVVYDDPLCVKARRDGKVVVTALWVEHSYDLGMPIDHSSVMYRPLKDLNGIPGAENFIMCLTGYQRQDRDDVMMMVNLMGSQFSKPLIANKVTHLICYKFEGEKYELAKKMKKIKLINHMWLEDCLNAWEILPESNYAKSGYELEMEAEAKDSEEEPDGVNARQSIGRTSTSSPSNIKVGLEKPPVLPLASLEMSNIPLCPIVQNATTDKRNVLATGQESTTCQSIIAAEKPELFGKSPVSVKIMHNQASTSGCSTLVAEVENENASTPKSAQRSKEMENGNAYTPKSSKRSPSCHAGIISDPNHMRKTPRRLSPQGGNSSNTASIKMSTTEFHVANNGKSPAKVRPELDGTVSLYAKTPLKQAGSPHEEVLSCILPLKRKADTSFESIKVVKAGLSPSPCSKIRHLEAAPPIRGELETGRQQSPINAGSHQDKSATLTSNQDSPSSLHIIKSLGSGKSRSSTYHATLNNVVDEDKEVEQQPTSCWEFERPNYCRKLDTEAFRGAKSVQETSVKSEYQKRQIDVKAASSPAENEGNLSNSLKRKKSLGTKSKYTSSTSNKKGSLQVNGISKNNFAESSNKVMQATDTTDKSYSGTASTMISLLENVKVAAEIRETDVLVSGFQLSSEYMDEETEAPDGNSEAELDKISNLGNMRSPQIMLMDEVQEAENSAKRKYDHAVVFDEGRDSTREEKAVSAKKRDTIKAIKGNTMTKKASKRDDMTPLENMLIEEMQEPESTVKERSNRVMASGEDRDSPKAEKAVSRKKTGTPKAIKGNTTKRNASKGESISHQDNFSSEQTHKSENSVHGKSDNRAAVCGVSDSPKVEKAVCASRSAGGTAIKGNTTKRKTSKGDNMTHEQNILSEVQTEDKNVNENINLAMATPGGRGLPKAEKADSVKKTAKASKTNTSKRVKSVSNSKMDPVLSVSKAVQPEQGVDGVVIQNKKNTQKITAKDKNAESVFNKVQRPTEHVSKLENPVGLDGYDIPSCAEININKEQDEDMEKTALKTNKKPKKAAKLKTVKASPECKQLQMAQKRLKEEPKWFILSGHRLQRKEFQKVIRSLKGRLCRDTHQWSYHATHFIVPDPIRRTEKFFAAAASGRWILKTDYVSASSQAGKMLAEEPYEWYRSGLSEDGAVNLEAPRKWRHLRERTGHGALHGMRIVVYGDCIAPPLDTLKRVVKAGDGVILATSPPYSRFLNSGVHFAIVSPGMPHVDMWIQEFLKHEIPCVVADYLVEYICKPGFSLEKHVLYNTHSWAEKSVADLLRKSEEIVEDLTADDPNDSDITCQVCGSADRGEVMLICGDEGGTLGCGIGAHIDCCNPPLEEVPKEDWFCAKCSINKKSSKSTKKVKM